MIHSMTGFGRSETTVGSTKIVTEVKSVNHRNMEIVVRLPYEFSAFEIPIRKIVQESIVRGRVEISMRSESDPAEEPTRRVEANLPLIRRYRDVCETINDELGLDQPVDLSIITGFRDTIIVTERELDSDELWHHIEKALRDALSAVSAMRENEGALLEKDLCERVAVIEEHTRDIETRAPAVIEEYRGRLTDRVRDLTENIDIDESRLSQEVAVMAEKSDITEEIVRLGSHAGQFLQMIRAGGPLGRKLDFMLQEMHREVNTIGSKSNDIMISQHVIELKSEIAKLREQVQNVE